MLLRFHHTIVILLTFFFYELRSRTLCTQWTYHVTPARLLVRFLLCHMFPARVLVCPQSRFTCIFTLLFWAVDSSMLTILSYAYSFCLVDSSAESLFLDYDSSMTHFPFMTLCTCISQSDIYTIEDGDSSLIFNLLCNHPKGVTCEIPRTLLVPSSSLAKATASRFLGVRLLCLLAYR